MWSSGRAPPTRYQRPMKVASALVSAAFGRVFIISATDRDVLSALPFLLGNNDWSSGTGSGYFLGRVCVSALRYNIDATDDDEGPTGPSAAAHFGQEMWERADPPSSNSEALSMTNASLPLVFDIRRMLPPAGGDRALQTAASALQRTLTGKSGFYEKVLHFRDQLKLSTPVAKTLKHLIGDGKHHKYTREEKLGRIKKLLEHAENVATDKAKMVHDGIKHAATAIRDADEQMLEYAKSVASRIPEATKKRIKEAAHGLSKDLEKLKKATGDTLKGAYEAVHEWEKKLASGYRRAVQSKLSKYLGVLKSTAADKGAHVMSKIVKVTSGAKVAEFFFTLFKKEVSKQLSRVLPDAKAKQALTDIAPHLQTVATTFINDVIAHQLWNGLHESFTHHHDAQVAEGDAHLNDSPDAAAEAGKEEYSADPQDKLQAQAITAVESLVIQMLSDILQVVFLETTWTGISRNVMTFVDDMCVTSLELLIVATSIGVSIPYPVLEKICHIIVEKPFETHVMNAVPKFLMGTTSEGLRMILGKSNTVHTVATAIANVIVDTEKGPPAVTGHLITWHQFLHTDYGSRVLGGGVKSESQRHAAIGRSVVTAKGLAFVLSKGMHSARVWRCLRQ
ncbi:unnamed protein product [Amoebophrya sp. A120]|nr:unnamed protein product [Amoebophrya sp. A120]|eukprot:GSA120T00005986001.1